MAVIVADTDVLIDALQGKQPAVAAVTHLLDQRRLATTVVTVFEMRSGALSARAMAAVESLLAPLRILALDDAAAAAAADGRRGLEASGVTIGMADYLIAGICLAHSMPLLTRNRRHFERVPGLALAPLEPGEAPPTATP